MLDTISLHETDWHGQRAWTLESEHLRVTTVPEMGAKIVSVYDKSAWHVL